ncbi:MAG TPA: hypothetical protein VGN37_04635 [Actinocatenispora sp.]
MRDRFVTAGVAPDRVAAALADGGDALHAAVVGGAKDWAEEFGGPLAAALLAAEVSALTAHLNSRASAARAIAVDVLLDEFSAVSVAASLGVSRQKVYDLARTGKPAPFIDHVPWSQP